MSATFLTNQFLIAMPGMDDPNFAQTVTLVCEHSARGALGIVINRPLTMDLGEVFEQLGLDASQSHVSRQNVLLGGPVQTDRGFVLHSPGAGFESTLPVSDKLHLTTSRDILDALASGHGPGARDRRPRLCGLGGRPARGRDGSQCVADRAGGR